MSLATFAPQLVPERDWGRRYVRLCPDAASRLGLALGDLLEVALHGENPGEPTESAGASGLRAIGRLMPAYREWRGTATVQLDPGIWRTLSLPPEPASGTPVSVRKAAGRPATQVELRAETALSPAAEARLATELDGLPLRAGEWLLLPTGDAAAIALQVLVTEPPGIAVVQAATQVTWSGQRKGGSNPGTGSLRPAPARAASEAGYHRIGGLDQALERVRELVELPLRHPEVFARLGIDPPRGILLYGPPGCGKTLIARAVAAEAGAHFFLINGPETIHKFYGESEAQLRRVFEEARKRAPAIVFIDEIDALAPKRDRVTGEVEKRVVAQLLALLDGVEARTGVIVMGATNLPNALDPALRRPGRFDREITIAPPDRAGRRQILGIHTSRMPLASDVNLEGLAGQTPGFVGADLEALCREAALASLRRAAAAGDPALSGPLAVTAADFAGARAQIRPSALREVWAEIPAVSWDQIGGLEQVKQELWEAVEWPLLYGPQMREFGLAPARGILLEGPPGCGKTLLAQALATAARASFLSVKGPELLSRYVGDSERAVRELFARARQAAPAVLFFDEIDSLLPRRGNEHDSGVGRQVLGQFLTELDGVEDAADVFVLAATNRLDLLDPALVRPGRFDRVVRIPAPDAPARRSILQIHLAARPVAEAVDWERWAGGTEGWSGAELEQMANLAARRAFTRQLAAAGRQFIQDEDLAAAWAEVRRQRQERSGAVPLHTGREETHVESE
jgi:transitional endoplasmic reticulum ATPase